MAEAGGPLQKPPGYRDPNAQSPQPHEPNIRKPHRKPGLPPTGYKPQKKRRSCCGICCCCCALFFFLVINIAIFAAFFYFWFDPKPPSFRLQSFQVKKFDVTAKRSGALLNAQTRSQVEPANPNKRITFYYGATEVLVRVGDSGETNFGSATLGEFSQGPENTTSLTVDTTVSNQPVEDQVVAKLRNQYKSKALALWVELRTSFGVGFWGLKVGMFPAEAICGGLPMKQVEAGGTPQCHISVLGINIH